MSNKSGPPINSKLKRKLLKRISTPIILRLYLDKYLAFHCSADFFFFRIGKNRIFAATFDSQFGQMRRPKLLRAKETKSVILPLRENWIRNNPKRQNENWSVSRMMCAGSLSCYTRPAHTQWPMRSPNLVLEQEMRLSDITETTGADDWLASASWAQSNLLNQQ